MSLHELNGKVISFKLHEEMRFVARTTFKVSKEERSTRTGLVKIGTNGGLIVLGTVNPQNIERRISTIIIQ